MCGKQIACDNSFSCQLCTVGTLYMYIYMLKLGIIFYAIQSEEYKYRFFRNTSYKHFLAVKIKIMYCK